VAACVFLLAGCGKEPVTPTVSSVPSGQETVTESKALSDFRAKIVDNTAQLAAAYLGYADIADFNELTDYLKENGFYERYPLLLEMTEEQFLRQEGGEFYLLVPAAKDISLTIYDCAADPDDYTLERGEKLLALESGQPVILQGNLSEIVPNLWAEVSAPGKETLQYIPSLSMMDNTLIPADGVYDCSDYEHLALIWEENLIDELPAFCGFWYGRAEDGDGNLLDLELGLWSDGFVNYSFGSPEGETLGYFEGSWEEADGVLTLNLQGGSVDSDSSTENLNCSFFWNEENHHLSLNHISGDSLLYGAEGVTLEFMFFYPYLLAGQWSATAPGRNWVYDLTLLEDGKCLFTISGFDEGPAIYEGYWSMDDTYTVYLDLSLCSGRHPENPEAEEIYGNYLAVKDDSVLTLSHEYGWILTLDMEEYGYQVFEFQNESSCVSIHSAEELSVNKEDCDWVIIDDTLPLEAAFCTMVPVEDFTLVSLLFSSDGTEFAVTELYHYGTLTPDRPLFVTLTDYGALPAYGVSFTDPDGVSRLFGITLSGNDGTLILTELS